MRYLISGVLGVAGLLLIGAASVRAAIGVFLVIFSVELIREFWMGIKTPIGSEDPRFTKWWESKFDPDETGRGRMLAHHGFLAGAAPSTTETKQDRLLRIRNNVTNWRDTSPEDTQWLLEQLIEAQCRLLFVQALIDGLVNQGRGNQDPSVPLSVLISEISSAVSAPNNEYKIHD